MARKKMGTGVKVAGGVALFALLMAMMSNGDPDGDDAWGSGDDAQEGGSGAGEDVSALAGDAWSEASPEDGGGTPTCDGTAPFAVDEGTVRLPVHGSVTPGASPVCLLDGSQGGGEAVRVLQVALTNCNDQPVTVDGGYGPATRAAVAAVQGRHGLEADGAYGPQTRAVVSWPLDAGDGAEDAPACVSAP